MAAETVRALVEGRAAAGAGQPYLIGTEGGATITFAALRGHALGIAGVLAAKGLGPGDRVALLMPNGPQAATVFVAVMAAGAVVTPLSLLATPEQLAYVLNHSRCRLVFCAPDLLPGLERALRQVGHAVAVEVARDLPGDPGGGWPWPEPQGRDDALLMYTSGTTGRPKGVRLTHGNVLAGARFVSEAHALTPADRVLAVLPLYHINAQVVTVLAPLYHGGSAVMPPRFSAGSFWRQAAEHGCTWINVVPTIIAYLLSGPGPGQDLPALRFCRSASAPLAPEHHWAFEARFGIGIIETMGLTETAAPVFANPLDPACRTVGSPGQPFGNLARIADPVTGHVLGDGEAGEIQISGPNVMAGYLDNPEETAKAFSADGWLRTGDLGYRDAAGFYFVTGRLKELIIKGGENIAPREIDEVLLTHPAVLEAVAVGVPDPLYGQDIEAAVILKPGIAADPAALQDFCRGRLGRFKTPRAIRVVTELPRGPSGKVQRLRLLD